MSSFEALIADFERVWQQGVPPDIGDYLAFASGDERKKLVVELIAVDLEYRWRTAASKAGEPAWTLAGYAARLAELAPLAEFPVELIEEEYRVRSRWGDKPSLNAFAARHQSRFPGIQAQLERIDRELREEAEPTAIMTAEVGPALSPGASSAVVPDPRAPLPYRDFLLHELIGAGRSGRVYRATQRNSNRLVAVKYLRKSFQRIPEMVDRFINEGRTVSGFRHPGIVQVEGVGQTPAGGYFIVMELVEGSDLSRIVLQGTVSIADALRWTIQVCDALEHAHERGIIHCDLKPANLLLDRAGLVRVTDFGLARPLREEAGALDRIEGTCGFMAPEQVSGWWGPLTCRTDIYGVGAVLFNLLTGEAPNHGATIADILAQVVSGVAVRSARDLRPDIPAAVNDICARCLMKSSDDRYPSMRELEAALGEAMRHPVGNADDEARMSQERSKTMRDGLAPPHGHDNHCSRE